jgi:hypothetical protein
MTKQVGTTKEGEGFGTPKERKPLAQPQKPLVTPKEGKPKPPPKEPGTTKEGGK